MSRRGGLGFIAWVALSAGCCPKPAEAPPGRNVCTVHDEDPKAGLPRLYREAALTFNRGPGVLLCEVHRADRTGKSFVDRCDDDVDDLEAILGTAKTCGPGGVQPASACPPYSADRIEKRALPAPATCGGSCPDVEVAVREVSGTVTRIRFYDDPPCHSTESMCEGDTTHACYYRVLSVTSELR